MESVLDILKNIFHISSRGNDDTADAVVGIYAFNKGFAAVLLSTLDKERPYIKQLEFHYASELSEQMRIQTMLVSKYAIEKVPTFLVLPSAQYQMFLLEEPNVTKNEIKKALPWELKDRVDFPIDNGVYDYIELPFPRSSDGKKMIYAVATQEEIIAGITRHVAAINLKLKSIDIPEVALCNLGRLSNGGNQTYAILHLSLQGSKFLYLHKNKLCITRNIAHSIEELFESMKSGKSSPKALNNLANEVSKSIDYCMSAMHLEAPHKILLTPLPHTAKDLIECLEKNLEIEVEVMDFNSMFTAEIEIDAITQSNCTLALAAALKALGGGT